MKKMLTMFFLLLCLSLPNGMNSSGEIVTNKDNTSIIKHIKYNNTIDSILVQIGEKNSLAYQDRESIPIFSPIEPKQIQRISSDYGWRKHPIFLISLRHHGIDISASLGTPVRSTANGVVVKAQKSRFGYGNEVIIKHVNNYETRYAHLDSFNVKVGQTVELGTVIGTVGVTGLTTGPHLHYEILKNKKDIDPLFATYVDKKNRSISNYSSQMITLEKI